MLCSGIKECVTVKHSDDSKEKIQKRLILTDLKDLYNRWKQETEHSKIPCLAFFVSLKPKQCLYAGDPGTHNICVCAIHQNFKLKLSSLGSDISYKDFLASGVCSIDNRKCMLNECSECPSKEGMRNFLMAGLDNVDGSKTVKFLQWTKVETGKDDKKMERVSLQEICETFDVVLEDLIMESVDLKKHHYIARKQSDYYAWCRKNVEKDSGIITMDFAENFEFIAQNSIQAYFFNNSHATLFTVVLYYKDQNSNEVKKKSFCIISDIDTHEAYVVHAFIEPIVTEIKTNYPFIKSLKYFSDGAPQQFKNK